MISSELLNLLRPNLVWWYIIMSQIVFRKGHGHSEGLYNQNMTLQYFFWTADPLATKLGLMAHHHQLDCLVKRLDCSVVIKVKVTEKVNNSSDCSSGLYLLDCWTFHNQTWYGNSSSWARVSCIEILFAVFKFKVTVRAHIIRCDYLTELRIFLQPNLIGWYTIISWSVLCQN